MTHLEVRLLGPVQVSVDGKAAAFRYDKVRALLAYLAEEADRPHRRESLAALLWPEAPEGDARRNVSQALYHLRQLVATDATLIATRDSLQFGHAAELWLDTAEFNQLLDTCERHAHPALAECAACRARLEQAVALYRGDFLHQLAVPDSGAFEEWATVRREDYRQRALRALATLAAASEHQHDFAAAQRYARRQIELEPWREEAHQQLMRALALAGQRTAALAQYEALRQVLADELGVEPARETQALQQALKTELFPGEAAATSPAPAQAAAPMPLPRPPTAFVGRARELAELEGLLTDPTCRLLTLVGPGGIGKTRLALQLAAQPRPGLGPAAFVSLAAVSDGALLPAALGAALGFTFSGAREPQEQLLRFLEEQALLIVLDNIEHLLASAPATMLVSQVLATAPRVKLLVTSRVVLDLQGEWVYEVEGLAGQAPELFAQSARRARAGYQVADDQAAAVQRIGELVGGLPLGIELAAAWVRVLSPREIATEIERNLGFLATAARDVPERHRSLQAVFDHSWQLLSPEEQQGLRRLAVFRGGFGREAADQVAQANLALLSSLVSRSLLRRTEAAGVGRYDLHELVRQYAAGKLAEAAAEAEAVNEHHCEYYTRLIAANELRLKSAGQLDGLAELRREADNLRQAWAWAVSHARQPALDRAARGLQWFFDLQGWLLEGAQRLGAAADVAAQQAAAPGGAAWVPTLSLLRTYQALSQVRSGQVAPGRQALQDSLALARPLGPGPVLTDALALLGLADYLAGDYPAALTHLNEALAVSLTTDYRWSVAFCQMIRGMAHQALGALDAARADLETSLANWRATGNPRNTASCLIISSALARQLEQWAHAEALLREALALSRATNDPWSTAIALEQWSAVVQLRGAAGRAEAAAMLQESVELLHHLGDRWGMAQALTRLGELSEEAGAAAEAEQHYLAGARTAQQGHLPPLMLAALLALAELRARAGTWEFAVQLAGWIREHPAAAAPTRARAEALWSAGHAHLTPVEQAAVAAHLRETHLEAWLATFGPA